MAEKPSPEVVRDFHTYDDVDTDTMAHHHTLGPGNHQAASGSHRHNGADSALLFEGITITGSKGGNTALSSVIALLTQFGATDSTT